MRDNAMNNATSRRVAAVLMLAAGLHAQTKVDLETQSKNVDFSGMLSTKPFKSGTTIPATCTVGETFFKTDAPAGANVYGCTATNAWTVESGGGTITSTGLADLAVTMTSPTMLTLNAGTWGNGNTKIG